MTVFVYDAEGDEISFLWEEDPNMYFVHSIAAIELEEVRGSLIKVTYSVSKLTSSWPRQICSSERPHLFPLMQYNLDHSILSMFSFSGTPSCPTTPRTERKFEI